ncbi:glycoside hydrolase family 36 protein [Aestuariimicrobium sp. T2.26MG-19.2B]|uniref:glycoside hydrolase family 36 protein n=1 Tax=Aestuariimicrobium sp. T2.26MG-19.2B TaxID=3040679 RepID=UPI002477CA2A|nr:glycoside hydrolase family 36 protein [Aestuariimicrobium sp. T2.26MG-19.2B]CAI9400861.1 hypothetical protein AESSP_00476 [Aestuariimicrobium sp. T2.26MG-19.2B]
MNTSTRPGPRVAAPWRVEPLDGAYRVTTDDRVAFVEVMLPATVRAVHGFTSSWGLEFRPVGGERELTLAVESGRSSQGAVPWLGIETDEGWWTLTWHWSGNWAATAAPTADGCLVTITFPDHVGAGAASPALTIAHGATRGSAGVCLTGALMGAAPRRAPLLTEWNHWWPYEDAEINEDVFLANAAVAAELGLEVAVLDAGWFGADGDTEWYRVRGDWHLVNNARFPHGLAWLADRTRDLGIDFGVWIEAEALGEDAAVSIELPEIVARDEHGTSLGYVCLGSAAGLERVRNQVVQLATTTRARWIKWDFNLDPGRGCRRTDHGHGSEDGLVQHYLALYRLFDELHELFPDTVWEACASGGLRIDAGLAEHVDAFFLSDPDWTEHHLAVLWGASQLLPARQILHWMQSEWRGEHRFQKVDYSGTLLRATAFDTMVRAALLHRFGVSARLTEMRPDLKVRLAAHVAVWKEWVRPLLENGSLSAITPQPLMDEQGHRTPAFQLVDGATRLVVGFRLPPSWEWEPVVPQGLQKGRHRVTPLPRGSGEPVELTSDELTGTGLPLPPRDHDSALWLVEWLP